MQAYLLLSLNENVPRLLELYVLTFVGMYCSHCSILIIKTFKLTYPTSDDKHLYCLTSSGRTSEVYLS